MLVRFSGNTDRHPLDKRARYNIDFKNENNVIFVDVYLIPTNHFEGTFLFTGMQEFLDSFVFDNVKHSKRVRRGTDFDRTLFFTTGEVGEYLGISTSQVRRLTQRGVLKPARRTEGGRYRYARETVVKYLEDLVEGGM